jgi:hypothetical protein
MIGLLFGTHHRIAIIMSRKLQVEPNGNYHHHNLLLIHLKMHLLKLSKRKALRLKVHRIRAHPIQHISKHLFKTNRTPRINKYLSKSLSKYPNRLHLYKIQLSKSPKHLHSKQRQRQVKEVSTAFYFINEYRKK